MKMTPNKPYLIRALYDWIVDNEMTPYIVVDAQADLVQIPREYVEDGKIILNISPKACRGLHLENDRIVFSARFSGEVRQIFVPPHAVMAIYAKENGRGMIFSSEDDTGGDDRPLTPIGNAPPQSAVKGKKPVLKVVK